MYRWRCRFPTWIHRHIVLRGALFLGHVCLWTRRSNIMRCGLFANVIDNVIRVSLASRQHWCLWEFSYGPVEIFVGVPHCLLPFSVFIKPPGVMLNPWSKQYCDFAWNFQNVSSVGIKYYEFTKLFHNIYVWKKIEAMVICCWQFHYFLVSPSWWNNRGAKYILWYLHQTRHAQGQLYYRVFCISQFVFTFW